MDSVSRQILRGHLTVNLPVVLIITAVCSATWHVWPAAFWWWTKPLALALAYIMGIALSWWYWSSHIPRWRLRAFSRVTEDDWLRLYRAAIRHYLIYPAGHVLQTTEIRTEGQAEQLTHVDKRLAELRQIEAVNDDFTTPSRLDIMAHRGNTVWVMLLCVVPAGLGLGAILEGGERWWIGLLGIAFGLYFLLSQFRYLRAAFLGTPALSCDEIGLRHHLREPFMITWPKLVHMYLTDDRSKLQLVAQEGNKRLDLFVDLSCHRHGNQKDLLRTIHVFWERHGGGDRLPNNLEPG